MSGGKYGGLNRATAESLLIGDSGQSARDARISALLTAASGPVAADELAGEQAVIAAFARSRRHRAADVRWKLRSRLAKLLASKTAAVVLVGSVAAGGAFATSGALPTPFNGPSGGDGVVPPPPATVSPHTATPGTEEEPTGGTSTEAPESPEQTPTPAPSTLPTDPPTPGSPTDGPTEPAGDPSSSPQPTDEPTRPGLGDPTTWPEDPDSPAAGISASQPANGPASNAADRALPPGRAD